ncbi:LOW QUALITY PROTEIN: hypothetical protein LguiB_014474 [Lonicera macranthoides]
MWNREVIRKETGNKKVKTRLTYAEAAALKRKVSKVENINNGQTEYSYEVIRDWNRATREKGTFAEAVRRGYFGKDNGVKQGRNTGKLYHKVMKQLKMDDWSKMIVCTRESLWHDWSSIQAYLNKLFGTEYELFPFLPDKAIFRCDTSKEADDLGKDRAWFSTRSTSIVLKKWHPVEVFQDKKVAFTGGWIEVEDLPLNLWRTEVFMKIGELCGGFEELDRATESRLRLLAPRLKVRGNKSRFIPAEIDLRDEEENSFTIRLKSCSSLDLKKKCILKTLWPEEGLFGRCVIRVGNNRINKKTSVIEKPSEELEPIRSNGKEDGDEGGERDEDFIILDESIKGGVCVSRGEINEEIKKGDEIDSLLVDGKSFHAEDEEDNNQYLVNVSRIFATLKEGLKDDTAQIQECDPGHPNVIYRGRNKEFNEAGPKLNMFCGPAERPVSRNWTEFKRNRLIKEKWEARKSLKVYKKRRVNKSKVVIEKENVIEAETDVDINSPSVRSLENLKEIISITDGDVDIYDSSPETDTLPSDTDFTFSDDDEEEMKRKEKGYSVIDLDVNGEWSECLFRRDDSILSKAVYKGSILSEGPRFELDLGSFKLKLFFPARNLMSTFLSFDGLFSSVPTVCREYESAASSSFIHQERIKQSEASVSIIPYTEPSVEFEAVTLENRSLPLLEYEQCDSPMDVYQNDAFSKNMGTPFGVICGERGG